MTFVLTPERASTVMKVSNGGTEPIRVQIQPMLWEIHGGAESLSETDQLIVNPPIVTIAPNQDQFVRLGARSIALATQERSYRLILEEVPMSTDQPRSGIRTILRISSPLFVPASTPRTKIDWSLVNADNGTELVAINSGNTHQKIYRLELHSKPAKAPLLEAGLTYLLPGQTRRWPIKKSASIGTLQLHLQTESGVYDQALSPSTR